MCCSSCPPAARAGWVAFRSRFVNRLVRFMRAP
jgi:hypothetical protein